MNTYLSLGLSTVKPSRENKLLVDGNLSITQNLVSSLYKQVPVPKSSTPAVALNMYTFIFEDPGSL